MSDQYILLREEHRYGDALVRIYLDLQARLWVRADYRRFLAATDKPVWQHRREYARERAIQTANQYQSEEWRETY